jgi:plasmid stabilization system protein ParE
VAKIIWTKPALDDLKSIFEYVARDSPDRAEKLALELLDAPEMRLEKFPDSGSPITELADFEVREIYHKSYRILYVHQHGGCLIVACIHGSRDMLKVLDPARWTDLP